MDKEMEKQIKWIHNKLNMIYGKIIHLNMGGLRARSWELQFNIDTEPKEEEKADPKFEDVKKCHRCSEHNTANTGLCPDCLSLGEVKQ